MLISEKHRKFAIQICNPLKNIKSLKLCKYIMENKSQEPAQMLRTIRLATGNYWKGTTHA